MNMQTEMPGMATDRDTAMKVLEKEIKDKKRKQSKTKDAAEEFGKQIANYNLPPAIRELRFAKGFALPDYPEGRQWRFDYAFTDFKLAIEIEGLVVRRFYDRIPAEGAFVNGVYVETKPERYEPVTVLTGRHATITGFKEDLDKYRNAQYLGWEVLRFDQSEVKTKEALKWTMRILTLKGWKQKL